MGSQSPNRHPQNLLALFSDDGLARLYATRQTSRPTEGNRTKLNLLLAASMVLTLLTSLFSLIWVQRSELDFLKSLSGVAIFTDDALTWSVHSAPGCSAGLACIETLRNTPESFRGTDLFRYPFNGSGARESAATPLRLTTKIDAHSWRLAWPETTDSPVVLSLPPLRYRHAAVHVNGQFLQAFYNSEPLAPQIQIDPRHITSLDIEIFVAPDPTQTVLVSGTEESYLVFAAHQPRYQKYADMVAAKRSGAGKQLADIARIVLAIFCLLLFIFVDSSPECLGLALFMGIKAIAVTFAQNWLPDWWATSAANSFTKNFLLCFGDIIQLYFFVQLARIARPNLKPWFLIGGSVALAYATAVHMNFKFGGIDWNGHIWRWRNISIGLGCMITALVAARYCFKLQLYNRTAALSIATSGTIVQIIYPLVSLYPALFQADWFRSLYHAFEMHTPYVFALSTFVNISSLETRVKSLSKEVLQVKEIEREMALGRAVQQAFLRIPEIPSGMNVLSHHEAALYVSGDVYFVHWDETRNVLVTLVTDVTGHGVQAALKASICSALAEAIWSDNQIRASDDGTSRLAVYDQRLHSYLTKISRQPEIVSIVGSEYDIKRRVCTFFRVNGVFPLLIVPQSPTPGWSVRVLALKNRTATEIEMPDGGFILYLSDGYIDTSRILADFHAYLTEALTSHRDDLSEKQLKSIVLNYPRFSQTHDDKTMLVLHCQAPVTAKIAA